MSEKPYPVPNSTTSFWRSSLHALDSHRTTDKLPQEADVIIVGAGYAGASVAHHLLKNESFAKKKPSIVILEAREACSGATGRNGGHLKPDPYSRSAKALGLIGKDAADEVTLFELRHMNAIGDLVEEENIDCDFCVTQVTDVCLYENGATGQQENLEKLAAAGVTGVDDVTYSEGKAAEELSGIKDAKGCLSHTAGHLYPYKLVLGLLQRAVEKGVNLQTNTPVQSVSSQADSNGRWTVTTSRGSISTPKVVYATNGYIASLVPELKDKIVPVRGICCRIVTSKPHTPALLTTSTIRFNDHEYDYLIPRSDGSIVVGGARRDYYTKLNEWFNSYDDSNLIEPAKSYFDGYMQRHFVGWEDSDAYVDQIWSGIMGYTDDGFPYVGNIPEKPGQYVCIGFNGHGMPQAFLSAKAVASMIADGTKLEEADLPRLYRLTPERFDSKPEHASITAYNSVMQKLGLKN